MILLLNGHGRRRPRQNAEIPKDYNSDCDQHSQRHDEDDESVGRVLRLRGLSRCFARLALNIASHRKPTFKCDADKARAPDEVINPAPSWNGRFCLGGPEQSLAPI